MMSIDSHGHTTALTHSEIVAIFHAAWPQMYFENACNADPACAYDPTIELPDEFFLYRDVSAFRSAEIGRGDDAYEGMIYVLKQTIVYDPETPADIAAILAQIPASI